MKKKSETRKTFEDRVKFLMSTNYINLNEEDKIHKIIIRLVLKREEYDLLKIWNKYKGSIAQTVRVTGVCKTTTESNISKIITKLKPFVWNFKNNPSIDEKERQKFIDNHKWVGDVFVEQFLDADIEIMLVEQ